ncbi:MAG TPA: hypothetical protein VJT31_04785 [Rugosimonospora sp.]|nr:hypothetical protein [Rugosimonospora sp.]
MVVRAFAALAGLTTLLAAVALLRTPAAGSAGLLALLGVLVAQAACVVAARFGPLAERRVAPAALATGGTIGALVGLGYGLVLLAEYASPVVSRVDIPLGYGIVGTLVAGGLLAGGVAAYRAGGFRAGLAGALWGAMATYMVWYPLVLITYHAFDGTAAQARALRAEGSYDDFARSGMADFHAFVLQDMFGAGFFHLILNAAIALVFGSLAAGLAVTVHSGRKG